MSTARPPSDSGYLSQAYAESFVGIGTPQDLGRSGGWIIVRTIPGSDQRDAMGCYPLFSCRDWSHLASDLSALASDLVSLVVISDPFAHVSVDALRSCFDIVRPHKPHFVTDLTRPLPEIVARRHRRNISRALRNVDVDLCSTPMEMLDTWTTLYGQLIERHDIRDLRRFSPDAFAKQLAIPGIMMFRATAGGFVVGIHLWYVQGEVAYGHLGATNTRGYDLMASYALYWHALKTLQACQVRWLDLGGAAGAAPSDPRTDGLARFKAGWATGTRESYLCGRTFQPEAYSRLAQRVDRGTTYFPAYRAGEYSD